MHLISLQYLLLYQNNIEPILLFLIFLALAIYIVYLHIQVHKRNILLHSIIKFAQKINKNWGIQDFLNYLPKLELSGPITPGVAFNDKILSFIFNNEENTFLLSHYTKEEDIAKNILKEGFRFINSFYKTTHIIADSNIDITHIHNQYRRYGNFIIIIGISKTLYENISHEIQGIPGIDLSVEHILAEEINKLEAHDREYLLPNQYIKGYIEVSNGRIVHNLFYQPSYHPAVFNEKIELMKGIKPL